MREESSKLLVRIEKKHDFALFSCSCTKLYFDEFAYIISNLADFNPRDVKFYFYFKVLCRHYKRPPSFDTVRGFFFLNVSPNAIQRVLDMPSKASGRYVFIPKFMIKSLIKNGTAEDLLCVSLFMFLTDSRLCFNPSLRNHTIPRFQLKKTLRKLLKRKWIHRITVPNRGLADSKRVKIFRWAAFHPNRLHNPGASVIEENGDKLVRFNVRNPTDGDSSSEGN